MGGTVTKSGVAVEGKAATEPANGKANGQVSASFQTREEWTGTWPQTPPGRTSDKGPRWEAMLSRHSCSLGRVHIYYSKDFDKNNARWPTVELIGHARPRGARTRRAFCASAGGGDTSTHLLELWHILAQMHVGVVFSVTRFQFEGVGDSGSVRRTKDEEKLAQRMQMRSKAGACCGAANRARVVSNTPLPETIF